MDMSRPSGGGGKSPMPMAVMMVNRRGSDFRPHSSSCSGRLGEADRPRSAKHGNRSRRAGSLSAIGQQDAKPLLQFGTTHFRPIPKKHCSNSAKRPAFSRREKCADSQRRRRNALQPLSRHTAKGLLVGNLPRPATHAGQRTPTTLENRPCIFGLLYQNNV